jgi:hypothetical protein
MHFSNTSMTDSMQEFLKDCRHRLRAVHEYEKLLAHKHRIVPKRTLRVSKTDDTEYCIEGCSRLHRLVCGHVVHTHQPTVCGSTCKAPVANFAPFMCTLCERWKMIKSGRVKGQSSHIAELILPRFPGVDQSHIPFIERARQCDVVYVLPDKWVFMPFSWEDIATVRLMEQRRLPHLIDEMMPDTAGKMDWPCEISVHACEAFAKCVHRQHLWVEASYDELAVACLYIAAVRAHKNKPGDLAYMATCFDVSVDGVRKLVPEVTALLIDLDARAAIANFMPTFENMFLEFASKAKEFASMVLRLWTMVQNNAIFPPDFLRENWLRAVASSIQGVLVVNNVSFSPDKVCAAVGTYAFGDMGKNMDVEVALLIADEHTYKKFSLWDRRIQNRCDRKLKLRKARLRRTLGATIGTSPNLDELITSIRSPKKTPPLYDSFASLSLSSPDGDNVFKRRRVFDSSDMKATEA